MAIGDLAFDGCFRLTGELKLPESLTEIGECAFKGCRGLTGELKLPESLKKIGVRAFEDCSGLTGELKLPEGLTEIRSHAFWGCKYTDIHIPHSVHFVSISAFYNYHSTVDIYIYNDNIKMDYIPPRDGSIILHGRKGSSAERYAYECRIEFKYLK